MSAAIPIRNPERVSGSILPIAWFRRRKSQSSRQILPLRVRPVDQVDLPLPPPVLKLLLAADGAFHVAKKFKVDKAMHVVARCEARRRAVAMLRESADKIGCDTDVQRSVMPARKDVGTRGALLPHGPESAARWMLKQVQHDEYLATTSPLHPNVTLNLFQGPFANSRGG